jgi:hypothetical protein
MRVANPRDCLVEISMSSRILAFIEIKNIPPVWRCDVSKPNEVSNSVYIILITTVPLMSNFVRCNLRYTLLGRDIALLLINEVCSRTSCDETL